MTTALEFSKVEKAYGKVHALHPTDLRVNAGEFMTLLGPSGSGKSTLLNIAAGHITPDAGQVLVGTNDVTRLPPRSRNIGMVFQNFALFPHMTVFENIAYGLRARGTKGEAVAKRVNEMLELVQLAEYGNRRITQLSGGQQQRVALARSLAIEPDVLLLDEPMGALDRQLRKHLQLEVRRLHRKLGCTMLFVTHDQEEALVMSDRIAVFREGRVEQLGTARALYEAPRNEFVASFLGESNLFPGTLVGVDGDRATLSSPLLPVPVQGRAAPGVAVGKPASLLVRPEAIVLTEPGSGWTGEVSEIVYLGEMQSLRITGPGEQHVWVRQVGGRQSRVELGKRVGVQWEEGDAWILPRAV